MLRKDHLVQINTDIYHMIYINYPLDNSLIQCRKLFIKKFI